VAALLNDFGRGKRAGGYAEVAISHGTMTSVLREGADLARIDVLILGASGELGGTAGRLAAIHPAHRDVLREPAPAILPLDRVAEVHRALEGRTASAKTVLAVR
jgi:hypothetical protein